MSAAAVFLHFSWYGFKPSSSKLIACNSSSFLVKRVELTEMFLWLLIFFSSLTVKVAMSGFASWFLFFSKCTWGNGHQWQHLVQSGVTSVYIGPNVSWKWGGPSGIVSAWDGPVKLVRFWVVLFLPSPWLIQDLIEKVMVLSRSIEMLRGTAGPAPGPVLAERITQYANLLASQGCLAAAMNYLPSSSKEVSEQQAVVGKSSMGGKWCFVWESWGFDMHQDLRFHLSYANLRIEGEGGRCSRIWVLSAFAFSL